MKTHILIISVLMMSFLSFNAEAKKNKGEKQEAPAEEEVAQNCPCGTKPANPKKCRPCEKEGSPSANQPAPPNPPPVNQPPPPAQAPPTNQQVGSPGMPGPGTCHIFDANRVYLGSASGTPNSVCNANGLAQHKSRICSVPHTGNQVRYHWQNPGIQSLGSWNTTCP